MVYCCMKQSSANVIIKECDNYSYYYQFLAFVLCAAVTSHPNQRQMKTVCPLNNVFDC